MDDNHALKKRFLLRAEELSNEPGPVRCEAVTVLFCDAAAFGVSAEAEMFQAAYGDPSGREYWDWHLSEPISVYTLALVLSAHRGKSVPDMELAFLRAFQIAAEAREPWFIGETAPLLAMEDSQTSFGELAKVKVHPRAAVEWLLSKPKRAFLVPESLRLHLQASSNLEPRDDRKPPLPDVDGANVICGRENKSHDDQAQLHEHGAYGEAARAVVRAPTGGRALCRARRSQSTRYCRIRDRGRAGGGFDHWAADRSFYRQHQWRDRCGLREHGAEAGRRS